jgi:carotenoid cleavage dioxygenase
MTDPTLEKTTATTARTRGNPFLSGNWEPVLEEREAPDLEVTHGEIPKELSGCFLRVGPNPRFPSQLNQANYHFFVGEGMVHCIELKRGKAQYRNRWIRSRKFRRDESENGVNTAKSAADFPELEGPANTALVFHAGRLLSMAEGTPGAWQLRLPSLETVGFFDYGGKLQHNFTAHPKLCPSTDELHLFGYGTNSVERAGGGGSDAFVHYSAAGPDGALMEGTTAVPIPFRRY